MTSSTSSFCATRPSLQPGYVHDLLESFERLLGDFRALGHSDIDEWSVSAKLQRATGQLDAIRVDLDERVEFCGSLAKGIREEPELLEDCDGGGDSASRLRQTLLDTRHVVEEANQIIQIIYKIVPMRGALRHVTDSESRQSIGKSMTTCGVRVERIYERRLELEDALLALSSVRVDGEVDLSLPEPTELLTEPTELLTEPTSDPRSSRREPRAASSCATDPLESRRRAETQRADAADDSRRVRCETSVSSSALQRVRNALNRWARPRLFVPSHVASRVGVVQAEEHEAYLVRLQVTWPGEEGAARPPDVFDDIAYRGAAPHAMILASESTPVVERTHSAESCADLPHGPAETVLAEAAQHLDSEFVNERMCPVLRGESPDRKAERVHLEIRSVPILHVTLGARGPSSASDDEPFEAWLVGSGDQLWVRGAPRMWTTKASAWLAATATIGVGVGYAIARALLGA